MKGLSWFLKKKKKDSKEEGKSKKPWFLRKKDKEEKESGYAKANPKGMGANTEGVKGFGALISGKKKKKY